MIENSLKENIHSKQNQPVVLKIQFGSDCREGMSLVLSLPLSLALTWTLWAGIAQREIKLENLCSKRNIPGIAPQGHTWGLWRKIWKAADFFLKNKHH